MWPPLRARTPAARPLLLITLALLLAALAAPARASRGVPAWAQPVGRRLLQSSCMCAGLAYYDGNATNPAQRCLQPGSGGGEPKCTAGDLTANITDFTLVSQECIGPDSKITLTLTVQFNATADTRYAIGLFLSNNGVWPNATGSACSITSLPLPNASNPATSGCSPYLTNADKDQCGDTLKGGPVTCQFTGAITVNCIPSENGKLLIPACWAYDNQDRKKNPCQGPGVSAGNETGPGTPSKCSCQGAWLAAGGRALCTQEGKSPTGER